MTDTLVLRRPTLDEEDEFLRARGDLRASKKHAAADSVLLLQGLFDHRVGVLQSGT